LGRSATEKNIYRVSEKDFTFFRNFALDPCCLVGAILKILCPRERRVFQSKVGVSSGNQCNLHHSPHTGQKLKRVQSFSDILYVFKAEEPGWVVSASVRTDKGCYIKCHSQSVQSTGSPFAAWRAWCSPLHTPHSST
jgi:hypothetical protein